MRNNRFLVAALIAAVIAGATLAGCSRVTSRQAGRELLDAVKQARSQIARALKLMGTPPFKVGEEYYPAAQAGDVPAERVDPFPAAAVNPKVLETLTAAREELTAALDARPNAPAGDRAVALQALGQINAMIGYYHDRVATGDVERLGSLIVSARSKAVAIRAQLATAEHYRRLAEMSLPEASERLKRVQEAGDELEAKIEATRQRIEELQAERQDLRADNDKRMGQASDLRVQARLAAAIEERQKLLEQALKIEGQINEADSKIATSEHLIEVNQTDLETLTVELEARRQSAAAIEKMLAVSDASSESRAAARREVLGAVAAERRNLAGMLDDVAQSCAAASAAADAAVEAYTAAAERFEVAGGLYEDPISRIATDGRQAQANSSIAGVLVRRIGVTERADMLVAAIRSAWEGADVESPMQVELVAQCGGDPAELSHLAAAAYDRAADLYAGVIQTLRRQADRGYRRYIWLYQSQRGAALYGKYRVTGDRAVAQEALAAWEEALEGDKAHSPNLEPTRELRDSLRRQFNGQPAEG